MVVLVVCLPWFVDADEDIPLSEKVSGRRTDTTRFSSDTLCPSECLAFGYVKEKGCYQKECGACHTPRDCSTMKKVSLKSAPLLLGRNTSGSVICLTCEFLDVHPILELKQETVLSPATSVGPVGRTIQVHGRPC